MRVPVFLLLAPCLLAAGCDKLPWAKKEKMEPPSRPSVSAPKDAKLPPPEAMPREIQLEMLQGVWRVMGVAPLSGSSFERDDKRILGSLLDIYPEQMNWSYRASAEVSGEDMCMEPVSGVIAEKAAADAVRRDFAPALAQFRIAPAIPGPPHEWLCGDGGSWDEDGKADFMGVDSAHLVMRWHDRAILLMERIRR